MNNISYIDCQQDIKYKKLPYIFLYITHTSEKCIKTALFQNGESAEYQIIFSLTVKIETQHRKPSLLKIKTYKSFFDNPLTILANSVKTNNIRKMIYEEASEELIDKLFLYNEKNN